MRRLLPIIVLLGIGASIATAGHAAPATPVTAPAPDSVRLADDTEARWVPFDLTPGNQIRFAMTLDGRPVIAILDTGVSVSLLARQSGAVDAARLRTGDVKTATAIGGAVSIAWQSTRTITLGGLTRRGGEVAVADLPTIATGNAGAVDLLVGRDLIGTVAIDIDYAHRRFRLVRSGRLPFRGSVAPLAVSPNRLVYETAMTLGDARLHPVIVDTGDGSSVTVTNGGWTRAGIADLPITTTVSFGLGGSVVSDLAIVPALSLGERVARDVEVRIEPAGGFSESIGVAGRIGSGFLEQYRVLLDPSANRMVLAPGPTADTPPLRSTSGLLLGVLPDRLRVMHVMRGGPAAAGGWRVDDLICNIDGQPITPAYATSPIARWSVGKPGTVVTLGGCAGAPPRRLTLAAFY